MTEPKMATVVSHVGAFEPFNTALGNVLTGTWTRAQAAASLSMTEQQYTEVYGRLIDMYAEVMRTLPEDWCHDD